MGKYSSIDGCIESFYQSKTIIVSGKVYDIKEYKKMQRVASKKKKAKKTYTSITILPSEIKEMIRSGEINDGKTVALMMHMELAGLND